MGQECRCTTDFGVDLLKGIAATDKPRKVKDLAHNSANPQLANLHLNVDEVQAITLQTEAFVGVFI